ncbi:fumarylacetoacetate hydrolase family protein [Nocardioides sp.]|uniref:fumarylacetoacetate hydrolase family protein n=1 Tax=Nocardioides sp. TaxID=35761 RepID=UPI0039E49800
MRWVTYLAGDGAARPGLVVGDHVLGYPGDGGLLGLLGERGERLREAAAQTTAAPREEVALAAAELLAPIPVPPAVRDFMAFEEHHVTSTRALGAEVDPGWWDQPVFYFQNPAAIWPPDAEVPIAPGSTAYDYELEVAAIIDRDCADVTPEEAEDYIAGYTIFCDWSARDLQATEMRQHLGPVKGKDTATSLGPFLVTPDELADVAAGKGFDLAMTATVNGRPYSAGNWKTIHWSFGQLISYAARGTTLRRGDVVGSGTVGTGCILELSRVHGADAYPWLAPGDEVELAVERLGSIRGRLVATPAPAPLG